MTAKKDIDVQKLMKLDLYKILDINIEATDQEVMSAIVLFIHLDSY